MKINKSTVLALMAVVLVTDLLFAANGPQKFGCSQCHKKEHEEFIAGIHKRALLTCADCHGGNINLADGMAHATNDFVGKPSRGEIPQFCGKCHSDKQKMRPYGLPADQVEQYWTSKHGIALKKGNVSAATCIDCHGKAHKIVSKKDTSSPVYVKNIPHTCGKCHSDKKVMSASKLPITTVEDYLESVHAKALYEKGITNAPQCVSCHSSHGASPPGLKEIFAVCGQCHVREQQYLQDSTHYKVLIKTKSKGCIFCHSNHKILHPTTNLYNTLCLKCHRENSNEFSKGREIKNTIDKTANLLVDAENHITKAKKKGFYTSEVEEKMSIIKTALMEVQPVTHSFNLEVIKQNLVNAQNLCKEIINSAKEMLKSIVIRRWLLGLLWIFIIIVCLVAWRLRRSFMKDL